MQRAPQESGTPDQSIAVFIHPFAVRKTDIVPKTRCIHTLVATWTWICCVGVAVHEAEVHMTKECGGVASLSRGTICIRPTEISAKVVATTARTTTVGIKDIARRAMSIIRWIAFTGRLITVLTGFTIQIGVATAIRFALIGLAGFTRHTI